MKILIFYIDNFFLDQTQTNGINGSAVNSNTNAVDIDKGSTNGPKPSETIKMWLPAGGSKEPNKWTVCFKKI